MALEGGIPLPSRLVFRQADGRHTIQMAHILPPATTNCLGMHTYPGAKVCCHSFPVGVNDLSFEKHICPSSAIVVCSLSALGREKKTRSPFNKKKPIFNPLGSVIVPLLSVCCVAFLFVQLHIMMFHNGRMRCETTACIFNSLFSISGDSCLFEFLLRYIPVYQSSNLHTRLIKLRCWLVASPLKRIVI